MPPSSPMSPSKNNQENTQNCKTLFRAKENSLKKKQNCEDWVNKQFFLKANYQVRKKANCKKNEEKKQICISFMRI